MRVFTVVLAFAAVGAAQEVSLEYRVKAVYLFNFTKFVEWPPAALAPSEPLTICVAESNPFGPVLADTLRGELVAGRPLASRMVGDSAGCHVLFVPAGVAPEPFLRDATGRPVLTVGESPEFLRHGGIVNFVMVYGKVRFEISQDAATRAQLRISSHLLRLAVPDTRR
jgi:hypothetical protein